MRSSEVWVNQRLSDCPGCVWIKALVWVVQSNMKYQARVIAGSKRNAYVRPEDSPEVIPKWHPAERLIVIEPGGAEL